MTTASKTSIDLDREQILRIVGNNNEDLVDALEDLFLSASVLTDGEAEQLRIDVGTALARGNEALSVAATSSGTSNFLGLSDVNPSSFNAGRIFYTDPSGSYLTDSSKFTFNGDDLVVGGTTDTSSGATGAINTLGGIGISKALFVGTTATITGALISNDTTDATSGLTGAIQTDGGIGISKALFAEGKGTFGGLTNTVQMTINGNVSQSFNYVDILNSSAAQMYGIDSNGAIEMGSNKVVRITDDQTGATDSMFFGPDFNDAASITTGQYLYGIGHDCMTSVTTASNCLAFGRRSLRYLSTGTNSLAIGIDVLPDAATNDGNCGFGISSLKSLNDGSNNFNTALGNNALQNLATGSRNTAVGNEAAKLRTGGSNCVWMGQQAGSVNQTDSNCIGLGRRNSIGVTGGNFVCIGTDLGRSNDFGSNFIAIDVRDSSAPLILGDSPSSGLKTLTINGAIATIASETTDTAPVDDTSNKKLTIQKLSSAPTNSAYIAFQNNPGSDSFYWVLEEA